MASPKKHSALSYGELLQRLLDDGQSGQLSVCPEQVIDFLNQNLYNASNPISTEDLAFLRQAALGALQRCRRAQAEAQQSEVEISARIAVLEEELQQDSTPTSSPLPRRSRQTQPKSSRRANRK